MAGSPRKQLQAHIDAVEGAYEFFLAYAAQGLTQEVEGSRVTAQFREHLDAMIAAVTQLGEVVGRLMEEEAPSFKGELAAFRTIVDADATKAAAVLHLIKGQSFPTSQLVDNLNASVHVRALLTDLFLLDEALALGVDDATRPRPEVSETRS
jgi:ABC-type transporter Mla subunit MlaD